MLLSIIIPVYNVEPYLRECLDSVFVQDLADCEVIAVNDGSTDGSRTILEEYKERYPDVLTIVDKANGGVSSARNAGVDRAMGDYIYFVDNDDWLKPHAVETIRKAVSGDEKADVYYFLDCIVTDKGKRWGHFNGNEIPVMDFRSFSMYAYENKIGIASNAIAYVYSTTYWRKARLHFEDGLIHEDALFESLLFVREDGTVKAKHANEPFYVYRQGRDGSITTKRSLKNFTDLQVIRRMVYKDRKDKGLEHIVFYHGLSQGCATMFYEAWESGLVGEHRKFWDRLDVRIMREGVTDEHEYGLWLLAKLNPVWMARYYANDLTDLQRRLTNIFLTVSTKLFYKGTK